MNKDFFDKLNSLLKCFISFESGDLLKLIDLKERFAEVLKEAQSDVALSIFYDKLNSYFIKLKADKSFEKDSPLAKEIEDVLTAFLIDFDSNTKIDLDTDKHLPLNENIVSTSDNLSEKRYSDDYFSNFVTDKEILTKFYDEVKEHLENAQISLLDLEYDPTNDENINQVFRTFHTAKSSSAFLGIKNMEEIAHQMEDLLVLIRDKKIKIEKEFIDIIFFGIGLMKDLNQIIIQNDYNVKKIIECYYEIDIFSYIEMIKRIKSQYKVKKIGEILEEEGLINDELVKSILNKQKDNNKKFGEIALEENIISKNDLNKAILKQSTAVKKNIFVKVSNDRLNSLIDMVGELVITQSMIKDIIKVSQFKDIPVEMTITQLESITTNIKNLVLSMGMVPIAEVFNKLRVVVRNVSNEVGKLIDVEIKGEETELDRNVIETIYDPLVHIVRNSCDHGIESIEKRVASGKNKVGKILIEAKHRGDGIDISVRDDGGGINKVKVLEKAVKTGLISEEQVSNLSDRDIISLMFLPGFSTAENVTEISGRGVGLDVVKKNIEQIRGKVDVESEEGKFTRFVIKIPLTLAIIDGFVVAVGKNRYIFPFVLVEEIIVPGKDMVNRMDNGQLMLFKRDRYIPLIFTGDFFNEKDYNKDIDKIIIVLINYEGQYYGLIIDEVFGKQEIVIKNFNEVLHHLRIFSGGTIFGDGSIGFVINIEEFMEIVKSRI